jgi:RHS repeat-associated protein
MGVEQMKTSRPGAETGGIHSNAYNFMSAVTSGVDPRTGMYSSSISLPVVPANNLCGPNVQLGLSFSPLNPVNAGFGAGWSLTTTRYDIARKRLSLSSGESFLVDTFVDDVATFKDRKLRSFDLIRIGVDGRYRIVHRSGQSEILAVLPGGEGVAVLCEVRSPEGYIVILDQRATNGIVRLRKVIDGTGRELLSLSYGSAATEVIIHPGTVQAASFTFGFLNDRLVSLALPVGYGDGWVFAYEALLLPSPRRSAGIELLLLKAVTVPTGGREEVDYQWDGHALPGAGSQPLTHMPVVTECRRYPYHGQPVMRMRYAYSENRNYFGFGVLNDWMDDEDNLYRVVMPPGQRYEYSSTETSYDGTNPARTVERTFNRFHLLTNERTSQEGCIKDVQTVYDEDPAVSFVNQKPWCQLPAEVRTTYSFVGRAQTLAVADTTTYDEHGNVLSRTDTRGATEYFSYFPVEGVEGECPADPLRFVRFLREKRAEPPDGSDGTVRVTRYVYTKLASRLAGDPFHIASAGGSLYERFADGSMEERGRTSHTFVDDGGDFHGRPCRVASYYREMEHAAEYAYRLPVMEKNARGDLIPALVTDTTKISGRGAALLQTEASVAVSIHSGLPVMDKAPDGGIMRYAYDHLGRDTAQTVAAGSEWEATTTCHYVLGHAGSGFGTTSVKGLYTYVALDGYGSPISAFVRDWNGDGQDHEIWRAQLDALGRKLSETTTDSGVPVARHPPPYDAGQLAAIEISRVALTTAYRYDGWGTCIEVAESNGLRIRQSIDPVYRTAESWNEAEGAPGRLRGDRTRTTSTISGKPWTVDVLDPTGALLSRREYTYDALDRLVVDVASAPGYVNRVTTYRYDFYNRLIETTLPDGAVVTQEHDKDTETPRVTAMAISHPSLGEDAVRLGEQAYDSLGRRTWLRVGQRETSFTYATATSIYPEDTVLPSGTSIACGYEHRLGGRLAWRDVDGDRATYVYDKVSGDLTSATNALGSHELTYERSGKLATETFRYDGKVRVDHHAYTLRGSPISYAIDGGDERHMIYDGLGRLSRLEGRDVVVDITYDAFSHRNRVHTRSRDGTRSMDVQLTLDEDGRELKRVSTARAVDAIETHTLIPSYTPDGKLSTRLLVLEGGERKETFTYDLRGRLDHYTCAGTGGPRDASGRVLASQRYSYDALDNVSRLETVYVDGDLEVLAYHYRHDDRTQLDRIEQVGHPGGTRYFSYDKAGNLERDELGRTLRYDGLGRPAGWARDGDETAFVYGPHDRIARVDGGLDIRYRYYCDGRISLEVGALGTSSFAGGTGGIVAQTKSTADARQVTLLGGDALGSTISEVGDAIAHLAYTPHGYGGASGRASDIGYAGELMEPDVDWYVLGHYRAYNPALLRFHSPDAASPFDHGGLNSYTYCLGDPINRSDPSGEGVAEWIFAGIGLLAAGAAIVMSGGTLGPAIGAALTLSASLTQTTAVALVAVDVTGVALGFGYAAAVDSGDDVLASKLSFASMMFGLAGLGGAVVANGAARVATNAASKTVVDTSRRASTASALNVLDVLSSSPSVKPPTLLRSKPPTGLKGGAPTEQGPFMQNALAVLPTEAAMNAMTGVQRVNLSVHFPHIGDHLVQSGFLARQLLDRFPGGINVRNGASVAYARMQISQALARMDNLEPEMVFRSGFRVDELVGLNPNGPDILPGTSALNENEFDMFLRLPASASAWSIPGEAVYRVFLQTKSMRDLRLYALAELQARGAGNWSRWNYGS